MIRQAKRGAVLLAGMMVLFQVARAQQPTPTEKVTIRDKKDGAVRTYDGILKFSAAGFQILSSDGKVLTVVSPVDIVKVVPNDLVGVERATLQSQVRLEDNKTRKDNEAARLGYIDLIQKTASAPPKTKQYLAFKKAVLSTRILDESDEEEWAKQVVPVAKEWVDFLSEYKTGWEIWPAARTCARLYIEMNKYDELTRMLKQLGAKDVELPADLKVEAVLQSLDAQIREGPVAYASVLKAAESEAKNAGSGTARDKLAIYTRVAQVGENPSPEVLAAAVKDIEEKIAASKDPTVRGVGYGMIGELYLASKRPRDALWAFMWVETVYNQDKDEVLKAMVRLTQIFKGTMDEEHEKLYREKIRRFRL